ncbi:MAG: DUF1285 domain-containing protein [Oligoflexia bacterium]|nr:DUF1285 domain-containing protein [Oligoflexia bacterium]
MTQEVLTLNKNGIWLADGEEITHEPTRKLFARSLKLDENGWLIRIGHETKRIVVEDTAFFVQRIDGSPEQGFLLSLSDGSKEQLNPKTLKYQPGRLTCRIGSSGYEAKFLFAPYSEILSFLEQDSQGYFLTLRTPSGVERISLGR